MASRPKPEEKREPEQLSEDAWRMVEEAMRTGKMTLPSGRTITLEDEAFVRLAQWLATFRPKRPTLLPMRPDDLPVRQTQKGSTGGPS